MPIDAPVTGVVPLRMNGILPRSSSEQGARDIKEPITVRKCFTRRRMTDEMDRAGRKAIGTAPVNGDNIALLDPRQNDAGRQSVDRRA